MITIQYAGRHGNQLFQFFAANLFSRKFKDGITNPLNTRIVHYDPLPPVPFDNTTEVTTANYLTLLNESPGFTNFRFVDYYQSKEIVEEFEKNKHTLTQFDPAPTAGVFVHVRLGDLLPQHGGRADKYLPFEYYDSALYNLPFDDGYISSDSPDNDIVVRLRDKYKIVLFSAPVEDTMIFASKCNMKVLSMGTFSWWIGFLGNQNLVMYPNPNRCLKWHGDIFTFKHWTMI